MGQPGFDGVYSKVQGEFNKPINGTISMLPQVEMKKAAQFMPVF